MQTLRFIHSSLLPSASLDAGHDGHGRFLHQPNSHDRLQLLPWRPMWNEDRLAVDERFWEEADVFVSLKDVAGKGMSWLYMPLCLTTD